MSRYVVVSRSQDEYLRVFGTFRDRVRADGLAASVNAKIDAVEAREFDEWIKRSNHVDHATEMAPDGYGRAGVLVVHPPRVGRILRFALGEMDS